MGCGQALDAWWVTASFASVWFSCYIALFRPKVMSKPSGSEIVVMVHFPPFSLSPHLYPSNSYPGVSMVMPGDDTPLFITLGNELPLEINQRFTLREGRKTVGTGVVTEILD